MKITGITAQQKDKDRVNVMVDGKYRFSLDIMQIADLGMRIGKEYTNEELLALEEESQFGKLYTRALEYSLMRPHSMREVRDYLYRKTRDTMTKTGQIKKGVTSELTVRVFDRLVERGYVNDEKFAQYWVDNRSLRKGASKRKIISELQAKGVESSIIEQHVQQSERTDHNEIQKVIAKKQGRYADPRKLMQYLARQGFSYDDIKQALESNDE